MSMFSVYLGYIFIGLGLLSLSQKFLFLLLKLSSKILSSTSLRIFLFVILGLGIERLISLPTWYEEFWRLALVIILFLEVINILISFIFPNFIQKQTKSYEGQISLIARFVISLFFIILALGFLFRFYIGPVITSQDCNSDNKVDVYCIVKNPEDLALTPDNNYLIISEFGSIEPLGEVTPGKISLLDLNSKELINLPINFKDKEWGDEDCEMHEKGLLSPHGIDLVRRADGRYQLAVVDHLIQESVEMFELTNRKNWELDWKGCTKPSNDKYLNDVSLRKDGSFYVSHMYDRDTGYLDFLLASLLKYNTGYVLLWEKNKGFTKVEGTEGAMPNGIAYDEEIDILYVVHNLGDQLVAVKPNENRLLAKIHLSGPDNLILKDKSVWVTTLDHEILDLILECGVEYITCNLPFSIYELDQFSLEQTQRISIKNSVFGLATVALPIEDKIWLGSFHSDRIATVQTN